MILVFAIAFVLVAIAFVEFRKRRVGRHRLPPMVGAGLTPLGRVALLCWHMNSLYEFFEAQVKKLGLLLCTDLPLYGLVIIMVR